LISTLSSSDTVRVTLDPSCGDGEIREYLRTNKILDIVSIRPNPSQDEIELGLLGGDGLGTGSEMSVEIFDALGVKVFSEVRKISGGKNDIHLDTKNLSGGMYFLRVGGMSRSFVKVR